MNTQQPQQPGGPAQPVTSVPRSLDAFLNQGMPGDPQAIPGLVLVEQREIASGIHKWFQRLWSMIRTSSLLIMIFVLAGLITTGFFLIKISRAVEEARAEAVAAKKESEKVGQALVAGVATVQNTVKTEATTTRTYFDTQVGKKLTDIEGGVKKLPEETSNYLDQINTRRSNTEKELAAAKAKADVETTAQKARDQAEIEARVTAAILRQTKAETDRMAAETKAAADRAAELEAARKAQQPPAPTTTASAGRSKTPGVELVQGREMEFKRKDYPAGTIEAKNFTGILHVVNYIPDGWVTSHERTIERYVGPGEKIPVFDDAKRYTIRPLSSSVTLVFTNQKP